MNMLAAVRPLQLEDTVEVSRIGHRLAMGVQWQDALMQQPVAASLVTDLEAIGTRPCAQRFEAHSQGRWAIRYAARVARLMARAVELAQAVEFRLRSFGRRDARIAGYSTSNDPRIYVPRRLALTPLLDGGMPPADRSNVRSAWLWPGAAYPVPANATVVRGRIRKGPDAAHAVPVAWARVVVTRPLPAPAAPNFATETRIAWGHGDDRGEFLVLLDAHAVPGGAVLPEVINLRLWVFLPPPAVVFSASDPLASLPLEAGGIDFSNDILRGTAIPPGYLKQASIDFPVRPGKMVRIPEATLLYG